MIKRISTFWIILVALLITSAVPLGLMALNAIRTTQTGVEREQMVQLAARVDAHASAIDERLRAFETATRLAAAQARVLLLNPEEQLTPQGFQAVLKKYQRDGRGVYGLDNWYNTTYLPQVGDNHQSNVFVSRDVQLTPAMERAIAVTEKLNPIFEAITDSGIGTQWVYLTLPDGTMRLYPWSSNDGYAVDWKPQTEAFYTIANAERDPQREAVWTAPYIDCAGAGLMVTNAAPIYNRDTLMGVMSHDFRIVDLQREVLGFKVGQQGYAFLLDKQGNVIAHKDYAPEQSAECGKELIIKLAEQDATMEPVVTAMLSEGEGTRTIVDRSGAEWVVVFMRIPTTDWHLGLMQPRREIIQPALDIAWQVGVGAIGLVVLGIVVSVGLARWISRPIVRLSDSARAIEASVDTLEASVGTDKSLAVDSEGLSRLRGPREVSQLIMVFSEMVMALQKRINELSSVYAMGQTITSTIDYEKTLQTVLSAVQRVVEFDAAELALARENGLFVEAWNGREGLENTTGHKHPLDQGLRGVIVRSKAALLIPTVSAASLREHLPVADPAALDEIVNSGVKSFLGVPLLLGERLLGMLTLVHHQEGYFTEDDRRQLSRLAAQASIAIENAIQVRQRESILKAQIRELQIEIDEVKKKRQVEEIVESDYFQKLREHARRMRQRAQQEDQEPTSTD